MAFTWRDIYTLLLTGKQLELKEELIGVICLQNRIHYKALAKQVRDLAFLEEVNEAQIANLKRPFRWLYGRA
jgi:hypothetical protein